MEVDTSFYLLMITLGIVGHTFTGISMKYSQYSRNLKLQQKLKQAVNSRPLGLIMEQNILHPGLISSVMKLALDTSSPTLIHLNKMV